MARSQGQRASHRQEERVARDVGGRMTSGSGNTDFPTQKGDVRKQFQLRIEAKTTGYSTYTLKRDDWMKIQQQAAMGGEMPAMQIEFQGQLGHNKKLAVIDWAWFLQLLEKT